MTAVTIKEISKSFGTKKVLDVISLEVPSGSLSFFTGPSGCGKTTLLRIIAGLETQDRGRILFDTNDVTDVACEKRHVGMVFQNYALWPHMSVSQNISFPLEIQNVSKSDIDQRTVELLSRVGLAGLGDRFPHELSGGQQQRVALARALAVNPKVLLMDEPFSNLDSALRTEVRQYVQTIHTQQQITVIIVSHDAEDIRAMATNVFTLGNHQ